MSARRGFLSSKADDASRRSSKAAAKVEEAVKDVLGVEEAMTMSDLLSQLQTLVTISALLAGFSVSVGLSVSPKEILEFVEWQIATYAGFNSSYCIELLPEGLAEQGSCDAQMCILFEDDEPWGHNCTEAAERSFDASMASQQMLKKKNTRFGFLVMLTVWIEMGVGFLGTLLLYSLSLQEDHQERLSRWYHTFKLGIFFLYAASMTGFFSFLSLISHVIKVRFPHCEDDYSARCLVYGTWSAAFLLCTITALGALVMFQHARLQQLFRRKTLNSMGREMTRARRRVKKSLESTHHHHPAAPDDDHDSVSV